MAKFGINFVSKNCNDDVFTNDTNTVFTVLHHKVGNCNMNKLDDAVKLDYFSLSKIIGS